MSIKSDESILEEGPMADARHTGHEEEFFSFNLGADSKGWLTDIADRCKHLPFRLRLLVQWLNECLSKADWKDMRQHG